MLGLVCTLPVIIPLLIVSPGFGKWLLRKTKENASVITEGK